MTTETFVTMIWKRLKEKEEIDKETFSLPDYGRRRGWLEDKDAVDSISKMYEGMDEYQKSFVAKENVEKIKNYVQKMQELLKLQELADDNNSETADNDTVTEEPTV